MKDFRRGRWGKSFNNPGPRSRKKDLGWAIRSSRLFEDLFNVFITILWFLVSLWFICVRIQLVNLVLFF